MKKIILSVISILVFAVAVAQIPPIHNTDYPTYVMLKGGYESFKYSDSTQFVTNTTDILVSYFVNDDDGNKYVVGQHPVLAEGMGFFIRANNGDGETGVPYQDTINLALYRGGVFYRVFTDSLFTMTQAGSGYVTELVAGGLSVTYTKKIYIQDDVVLTGLLPVIWFSYPPIVHCPQFYQLDSPHHPGGMMYNYGDTIEMEGVYVNYIDTNMFVMGNDTAYRYSVHNWPARTLYQTSVSSSNGFSVTALSEGANIRTLSFKRLRYEFSPSDYNSSYTLIKYQAIKKNGCDTVDAIIYQKYDLLKYPDPVYSLPPLDSLNFWYNLGAYFDYEITRDSLKITNKFTFYPHYLSVKYRDASGDFIDIASMDNSSGVIDTIISIPDEAYNQYEKISCNFYSQPDSAYTAGRLLYIPLATLPDIDSISELEFGQLVAGAGNVYNHHFRMGTGYPTDSTATIESRIEFYPFKIELSYIDYVSQSNLVFYSEECPSGMFAYSDELQDYVIEAPIPQVVFDRGIKWLGVRITSLDNGYTKMVPLNVSIFDY